MFKYFFSFPYYLETFAKQLSGRSIENPNKNGEYKIIENLIKNIKTREPFVFIDGGANLGNHSLKVKELCKKYKSKNNIFVIECHNPVIRLMKKNLKNINYFLINKCIGANNKKTYFYWDSLDKVGGQNSNYKHYYLNNKKKLQQITIDSLIKNKKIRYVNFLKLDIEGSEYKALLGARKSLKNGLIEVIQLEYNQTWIKSGATIEKVLTIANKYNYDLFRINRKYLLEIKKYSYQLEDYVFCNLLMIKKNMKLPLPNKGAVLPHFC